MTAEMRPSLLRTDPLMNQALLQPRNIGAKFPAGCQCFSVKPHMLY